MKNLYSNYYRAAEDLLIQYARLRGAGLLKLSIGENLREPPREKIRRSCCAPFLPYGRLIP